MADLTKEQIEAERLAFEAWFGAPARGLDRSGDGYKLMSAQSSWKAWFARASQQGPSLRNAWGARVEGDTVVIKTKGGNDGARELCGSIVAMIEQTDQVPGAGEMIEGAEHG